MIFDIWGGVLFFCDYKEFLLQYMYKIVDGLICESEGCKVLVMLFIKNGGMWLEVIVVIGCDVVGLDWIIDIVDVKVCVGDKVVLQGNMDLLMLYVQLVCIEQEVVDILVGFGEGIGYVFNLGYGIYLDVLFEYVGVFVEVVYCLSKFYYK